jgi:hypothetical protein
MAEPKLPPFMVGPRTGNLSAQHLHFPAAFDERRGLYRFVCDSQPLMTLTSAGVPKRCPLCGQNYPIKSQTPNMKGEMDAHRQGQQR